MAQLIDLSLELADGLSIYPGGPKMAVMNRITHEWSAGRYTPPAYSATDRIWLLNEHIGTHVDAPYHFWKDGASIDELPLDRFCGPAVLADVSDRDPAVPVSVDQIVAALEVAGEPVHQDDILVVRCWGRQPDDPGFLEATALAPEVGTWAVEQGVKAVGIDLPSVDSPGDRSFPVHMAFLPAGIPIFENLCHLDKIEQVRFSFWGLPLRVKGGSGSAVRAIAVVSE